MCSVTQNKGEINMKRKIILRSIIVVFLLAVVGIGVAEQLQTDIASDVVRLHIIANSDTDDDQRLKLAVRDAVLGAQKEIFPDGINKEITEAEKEKIKKIAQQTISESGAVCSVEVESGNWYFPTKKYDNITLPAGNYDGVRVVLGEGKGKNWWCVMYPPLCFTASAGGIADGESKRILKESMGDYEYKMITEDSVEIKPAFKLVEMWSDIKEKIK